MKTEYPIGSTPTIIGKKYLVVPEPTGSCCELCAFDYTATCADLLCRASCRSDSTFVNFIEQEVSSVANGVSAYIADLTPIALSMTPEQQERLMDIAKIIIK